MRLPRHTLTRAFLVVILTLALYAAGALIIGWEGIMTRLRSVSPLVLAGVALLSLTNYGLRFWRWEFFLRRLQVRIPLRTSLAIYFSAYVMVITPGKVGEVFKAGILKDRHGVRLATGLPVILAERIYDFLGVLILAMGGILFWPGSLSGLTTGLIAATSIPALLLLLRNDRLRRALLEKLGRSPILARKGIALDDALENFGRLLQPGPGTGILLISAISWLCEGIGFALVCRGLHLEAGLGVAVFIYAAGTIVGSLSFLPGGLGGTEATIIWLLGTLLGSTGSGAASAALLIRVFTLWLAVLLGFAVFLASRNLLLGDRDQDGDRDLPLS